MLGKKELMKALEEKDSVINELKARIEEYQRQSDALVGVMTDAKAAANRIIGAAEARSDEIIAAAEQERKDIESRRADILKKAREEAEALVNAAKEQAEEAEKKADFFRSCVRESAEAVRRQAEKYAAFLGDCVGGETAGAPADKEIKTPENYENTAELMHSIYAIQGRELPKTAPAREEEEENEQVLTVDDVPECAVETEGSAVDSELNDIINDILKLD